MKESLKEIKHYFFTHRNGIVADTLKQAGAPHNIIFGLQIPDLSALARTLTPDKELGKALWADSDVRESRLLACWLTPAESVNMEKALEMASETRTREEGDILAFRLLRFLPFAPQLAARLLKSQDSMTRHSGEALSRFVEPCDDFPADRQ